VDHPCGEAQHGGKDRANKAAAISRLNASRV
jgi:hypothetical protein